MRKSWHTRDVGVAVTSWCGRCRKTAVIIINSRIFFDTSCVVRSHLKQCPKRRWYRSTLTAAAACVGRPDRTSWSAWTRKIFLPTCLGPRYAGRAIPSILNGEPWTAHVQEPFRQFAMVTNGYYTKKCLGQHFQQSSWLRHSSIIQP